MLTNRQVYLGCDPEFFFQKGKEIIGSEKVIDIDKGENVPRVENMQGSIGGTKMSKIIVDGVQVEINPRPDTCRARLGNEIAMCFRAVHTKLQTNKGLTANFSTTVEVTQKELKSLNEKSRKFGCSPSKNTSLQSSGKIEVDPEKYKYRSAGGHIHLGAVNSGDAKAFEDKELLVNVLDIIVGNTCVLIDRDEGNKIRRQVYGKAGEFRTPDYGIEYRTLSNFWLKSYPLMSLVMNLSRLAYSIVYDSIFTTQNYAKELLSLVDMADIHTAINENDYDLAWQNYQKIKQFLIDIIPSNGLSQYMFPICSATVNYFEHFVKKGADHFFKDDPIKHWIAHKDGHGTGWEGFLIDVVAKDMAKTKKKLVPRLVKAMTM